MQLEPISSALGLESPRLLEQEAMQDDFLKLLQNFDATQETDADRRARLAQEAQAAQEKRQRDKKMVDLQAYIAQLRSRMLSKPDPATEAELSAAQTQLAWLMLAL